MPLPSSITLNVGSPAADVIFTNQVKLANEVLYNAPSAQNDLQGRPILRFSSEKRKTGIVSTLMQVKIPVWNSVLQKYDGFVTAQMTLTRGEHHPVPIAKTALEMLRECLSNNTAEVSLAIADNTL